MVPYYLLMTLPGEQDLERNVGRADLTQLHLVYGPCAGPCPADLNLDGRVDSRDRVILLGMLARH